MGVGRLRVWLRIRDAVLRKFLSSYLSYLSYKSTFMHICIRIFNFSLYFLPVVSTMNKSNILKYLMVVNFFFS